MPKKTFNEKLNFAGDLPKVERITEPKKIERYKAATMLIAAPLDYDGLMKKVPRGRLMSFQNHSRQIFLNIRRAQMPVFI
jgi:hypothetical protein